MTHPDGGIALFNDAALDLAPDHAALAAYAAAQGLVVDAAPLAALEMLPDSGYARLQAGAAVLIADVGAIGPDYLPGHAHADTLSFELSLHGQRLLVNGGTSTYAAGPERLRQRGTAAHNALMVDGQDSSEVWSGFRVARRARAFDVASGVHGDELWLCAAHDGYRRLPGRPLHRREWRLSAHGLRIVDRIEGRCAQARAHLRVHPRWQVEAGGSGGRIIPGDGSADPHAQIHWQANVNAIIRADSWHPHFGVDEPCTLIGTTVDGAHPMAPLTMELNWGQRGSEHSWRTPIHE
jgi:hypothetical protein